MDEAIKFLEADVAVTRRRLDEAAAAYRGAYEDLRALQDALRELRR